MFQIEGEFSLEVGDSIEGTFAVRKNRRHPRELDFKLTFVAKD